MAAGKITINETICKGCELCARACVRGCIALSKTKINAKGYHPAECVKPEECVGCAMCAVTCPDVAIKVERN